MNRQRAANVTIYGLMFFSLFNAQEVSAAIVGDASAPANLQPQINLQNNIPIVNISNPNAAGVSVNRYQNFDVDSRGVVLNNGINVSASVLAGQVAGNNRLTQSATHIVNEVKSGAKIKGAVEVAGSAAHVTIATPYGIEADNGEFINTKGATLSAGSVEINPNGDLIHHVGKDSQIKIGKEGVRGDSGINLYGRTIQNDGDVLAFGKLKLETGVYDLNTQTGEVTKLETNAQGQAITGPGSFQGEHIQVVANEKGFGVNLERMNAWTGDIQVAHDGTVTIGDSQALKDINIKAGTLNNKREMLAGQDINVSVKGTHTNAGKEIARRDNNQKAQSLHNQKGMISAGRDMTIAASEVDNEAGQIVALNNLNLTADKLNNHRGATKRVQWTQTVSDEAWHSYNGEQETTEAAEIVAGNDMTLNVKEGRNQASTIHADHILTLEGDTFDNASDNLKTKDDYSYLVWKNKLLGTKRRVTTTSNSSKEIKSELTAGQGISVKTKKFNNSGKVKAQNVDITSDQLNNGIFKAGDLTSNTPLSGGEISGTNVSLVANEKLTNTGYILGDKVKIDTHHLDNGHRMADYYAIEHGDGYWVEISGQKRQEGGLILANTKLDLNADQVTDRDGLIYEGTEDQKDKLKQILGLNYVDSKTEDALNYHVQQYKQDLAVKLAIGGIMIAGVMLNPAFAGAYGAMGAAAGTTAVVGTAAATGAAATTSATFLGLSMSTIAWTSAIAAGQTAALQAVGNGKFDFGQIAESVVVANVMAAVGHYTNGWGKEVAHYDGTTETNLVYRNWNDASGFIDVASNRLAANATKAVAMGAMSEWQGGDFKSGFGTSLALGLGTEIYAASVGHFADGRPGENRATVKYEPYQDGRVPRQFENGMYSEYNNIGLNDPEKAAFFIQNGPLSKFANNIPGASVNAIGTLHDQWMNSIYPPESVMPTWVSVGTMLPAAVVTHATLYEQHVLPMQYYMKNNTVIAQEYKK